MGKQFIGGFLYGTDGQKNALSGSLLKDYTVFDNCVKWLGIQTNTRKVKEMAAYLHGLKQRVPNSRACFAWKPAISCFIATKYFSKPD